MPHHITYKGFLQYIRREFTSYELAARWCLQVGRGDLIRRIEETT